MKKMFCSVVALSQVFVVLSHGKPMESYENYNVIMVHGAADSHDGFECAGTKFRFPEK